MTSLSVILALVNVASAAEIDLTKQEFGCF